MTHYPLQEHFPFQLSCYSITGIISGLGNFNGRNKIKE
jgi:hypothetical protein